MYTIETSKGEVAAHSWDQAEDVATGEALRTGRTVWFTCPKGEEYTVVPSRARGGLPCVTITCHGRPEAC